jgi:poly(3-hydroxyalkanoate) synthetase
MGARSKQLSFFLLDSDLELLGNFINQSNGAFIEISMPTSQLVVESDILKIPYLGFYLISKIELENIIVKPLKDSMYIIDFNNDNSVIEFCRGRLKDGKLRSGRILLKNRNEDNATSKLFDEMSNYISKTHKRMKIDGLYYRVSEATKQWIEFENGQLVLSNDAVIYSKNDLM